MDVGNVQAIAYVFTIIGISQGLDLISSLKFVDADLVSKHLGQELDWVEGIVIAS